MDTDNKNCIPIWIHNQPRLGLKQAHQDKSVGPMFVRSNMSDQTQNQSTQQPGNPLEHKSVVKPVTGAPETADSTATQLNMLLKLMMAKEARIAEAEEATESTRRARNAQREKSAKTHVEKQLVKQARCRHMKGGKKGPRSGVTDYAVYHHTFINGEQIIKCFICAMKWKINDTVEFLLRGKRQIANHTKIGWSQAYAFLSQSTNSPSMSAVPVAKLQVEFSGVEIE